MMTVNRNEIYCPVHDVQGTPHFGTGDICTCPQDQTPQYIEPEPEPVEDDDFCKKCGKHHKTSWCK